MGYIISLLNYISLILIIVREFQVMLKLEAVLPQHLDLWIKVGRYIPDMFASRGGQICCWLLQR